MHKSNVEIQKESSTKNQSRPSLIELADQLHKSNVKIRKESSTFTGKIVIWLSNVFNTMPEWATNHIQLHEHLENAIKQLREKDEEVVIPPYTIEVMDTSKNIANALFKSVALRSVNKVIPVAKEFYGMDQKKIGKILRSLKGMENISQQKIHQLFKKVLYLGNTLEDDFEKMIGDLGLDIDAIPAKELESIATLFFMTRADSNELRIPRLLFNQLFPIVLAHYKAEPDYDANAKAHAKKIFQECGILEEPNSQIDPHLSDMLFVRSKIDTRNSIFVYELMQNIKKSMISKRFANICQHLKNLDPKSINLKEVEKEMTSAMAMLHYLSKDIAYTDPASMLLWDNLYEMYSTILEIKVNSSKNVQDVMRRVLQQHQSFIEGALLGYLCHQGGSSVEICIQSVYGRSQKETESIKAANRKAVAEKIQGLANRVQNGEPLTKEMLIELHRINNQGIVPGSFSEFRKEKVLFGKRVAAAVEDIEPAMADVLAKANRMLKRRKHKDPISRLRWAIEVAVLHNEILDIHPFPDRNGSTCLLFVELMMAIKGDYQPSEQRNTNYYSNLSNILKNPIGVAIVAYEQYKITHFKGQYTYSKAAR